MALITTLFYQHEKAKAYASEVAKTLSSMIGHNIVIEFDWKFVNQADFKAIPVDVQKGILLNTLSNNITQCILGAQDSLAASLAISIPLRQIIATVSKILFSYDHANTINATVGVAHLNIYTEGSTLHFKSNLNAVQTFNNGFWGVSSKLLALASASQVVPLAPVPPLVSSVPVIAAPPVMSQVGQIVVSQPPISLPLAASSAPIIVTPKCIRVGGVSGGNGTATFLYTTINKQLKKMVELGQELSRRLCASISFEVDIYSLVKNPAFTKESEADQKAILSASSDSWAGALYASTNGSSTIENALRDLAGITNVKWVYSPSNQPTPGWSFLEVSYSGSDILIVCSIADVDEIYGLNVAGAETIAQAAAIIPHQQVFTGSPLVASPTLSRPLSSSQPISVLANVQHEPIVQLAASSQAITRPTPSLSSHAPGSRLNALGGAPGGNGLISFLFSSLEKLRKLMPELSNEFCRLSGSASDVVLSTDLKFVRNPAFMKHSQADQRAYLTGPMFLQISSIAIKMANGDHLAALFKHPQYSELCKNIKKVNFVYSSDIHSTEGYSGWTLEWLNDDTEININIDIHSIDMFPDDSWGVSKKVQEVLGKRNAEAFKLLPNDEARTILEKSGSEIFGEAERKVLEAKAAFSRMAEQGRLHREHQAFLADHGAVLEQYGVLARLKENKDRLNQHLGSSGQIEYTIDPSFILNREMNWRDWNAQESTLEGVSSLFQHLTDAAISIRESGEVGRKHLVETYSNFNLKFEDDSVAKIPRFVLDQPTRTLRIFATFSNMSEINKWIDYLKGDVPAILLGQSPCIKDFLKSVISDAGGWLDAMLREVTSSKIDAVINSQDYKEAFEGGLIPIEVDWQSMNKQQLRHPLSRMLLYFDTHVLEAIFRSLKFEYPQALVLEVMRSRLRNIRIVSGEEDSLEIENDGALMVVTYKWSGSTFTEDQWKGTFEMEVRKKCQGLAFVNLEAEIAILQSSSEISNLNQILHSQVGMIDQTGGNEILVVDYTNFVNTPEFLQKYSESSFSVLFTANIDALKSLVTGFEEVSKTVLGGPLLKTVKLISVNLDVNSPAEDDFRWDFEAKTFHVTFSLHSFENAATEAHICQIEYSMGILIETCRWETQKEVQEFYSIAKNNFCLPSLDIVIDESYQDAPQFKKIPPVGMKKTVTRLLTTVPASILHGPMGLKHCSEFPLARQILHRMVKKIILFPDASLDSNTSKLELGNGELLVRLALDSTEWETPIGYQLSQIIGSRSTIESEVVAEVNEALVPFTEQLRKVTKNPNFVVKFNWDELIKSPKFQLMQDYVQVCRYMLRRVKRAFDGSPWEKATFDGGLSQYLQAQELAERMGAFDELEFHVSLDNSIFTKGLYGWFTPYRYRVVKEGKRLNIMFNLEDYPVGVGSIVEWVLYPPAAQKRQASWITLTSERLFQAELRNRERLTLAAEQEYETALAKFASDMEHYNVLMAQFASAPTTEICKKCNGTGRRNAKRGCKACSGNGRVSVTKVEPQLPTQPEFRQSLQFPPITPNNFTRDLRRQHLGNDHFVE